MEWLTTLGVVGYLLLCTALEWGGDPLWGGTHRPLFVEALVLPVRLGLLGVLALALLRQWPTPLRKTVWFLLLATVLEAVAAWWFALPVVPVVLLVAPVAIPAHPPLFPWADFALLAAYICQLAALATLPVRADVMRSELARRDGTHQFSIASIDFAVAIAAAVLLVWFYLLEPASLAAYRGWGRLAEVGYPALNFALLLTVVLQFKIAFHGHLQRVFRPLAVAALLVFCGDALIGLSLYVGHFAPVLLLSMVAHRLAVAAVLLAGLRLMHPAEHWTAAPRAELEPTLSPISATAVALVMAALLTEALGHGLHRGLVLMAGAAVLVLLVLVRQVLSARRNQQWMDGQRQHLEALVQERTEQLRASNAQLELLARQDPLTGLANRREFDTRLAQAWPASVRAHQPLAVALLDVDLFKAYNDRHGHPAGDDCLRQVAQVLQQVVLRRTDLVARYGGEEFLVLMQQTDTAGATLFAEKIRAAIEAAAIPHGASTVAPWITVSIGVVSVVPESVSLPESLFFAADAALYAAKHDGRNCVRVGRT